MNAALEIVTRPDLVTIRASSLGELFDCPARWEAKYIDGKFMPRSGAAQLGTAVHAGTGIYDASRLPGGSVASIDDAESVTVDTIYKPSEDVMWDEDATREDAEKIARALTRRYCETIAPIQRYTGVEVKCERLDLTDVGISLTGTTDRVRATDGGHGIADLKTGKTAVQADGTVKTAGHAAQIAVYELLAEHAMNVPITAPAQIVGLQTGKTEKAQRVGLGTITDARVTLVGTGEKPGLLEHAGRMMKAGAFYGNPRSMLCGAKFCPIYNTCNFRR